MYATQGTTRSSLFSEGEKSCLQSIIPSVLGVGLPGCCVNRPFNTSNFCTLEPFSKGYAARGDSRVIQLQSDEQAVMDVSNETMTTDTITFVGNSVSQVEELTASMPEQVEDIYSPSAQLASFLQRPVRIATYSVPQGEAVSVYRSVNPWFAFLNDSQIKKKLDNYAYLRGNLHVEIIINATPFIYGMYMATYLPMVDFCGHLDYEANAALNVDGKIRVPLSQRQNVLLKSHTSEGGTMVLPFVYHKNFVELTRALDVQNLGKLTIVPMSPFTAAAAGATGNVSISIYAWMSDVKLAGMTRELALQSDEYAEGPISRPASIVAGIGRRLSDVPVVGKVAKAVGWGASAVSKIASLFGFTNVPVIENSMPYKNVPFHGMASAQIAGPIERLTLDPKAEITIEPGIMGLPNDDDLAIANFIGRESFVRGIQWNQSDTVDTLLSAIAVTPAICQTGTSAGGFAWFADTPVACASRLFTNWRGDMHYKLRIVKSQYHQGRFRVSFDPRGSVSNSTSSTVTFTKIIDLSEGDEFDFVVPYMQPQPWLLLPPSPNSNIGDRADVTADPDQTNGKLSITVLNPCTAPSTTAAITILVYVWGEPNLEFANPSDIPFNASVLRTQSKEHVLGDVTPVPVRRYEQNFGEQIASLRTLMRRTAFTYRHPVVATSLPAGQNILSLTGNFGLYPNEPGYLTAAAGYFGGRNSAPGTLAAGPFPCNYSATSPYTWLSTCFVGQRGSFMYKANFLGPEIKSFKAYRWNYPRAAISALATMTRVAANNIWSYGGYNNAYGNTGQSLVNATTQTGLEFSVPFMNKYNFVATDPKFRVLGSDFDDSSSNTFSVEVTQFVGADTNFYGAVDLYGCVGTDFTLVKFVSVPIRYQYTMPSPAL